MARERNPSGLPRDPIVRPMYGGNQIDVEARVGLEHEGFKRTERTFVIATVVVAVLLLAVAIFGSSDSAAGLGIVLLVPLLFFLLVNHVLVLVTRPKRRS